MKFCRVKDSMEKRGRKKKWSLEKLKLLKTIDFLSEEDNRLMNICELGGISRPREH